MCGRRARRTGRSARPERPAWAALTGVVLCAGLTAGLVSPSWAVAPADPAGDEVQLGSFALGDGLEGTIGEVDGSFGFTLTAGGVQLAWDSRGVGPDPGPLGHGWSWGLSRLGLTGGVWVYPASGGAFAWDATSPTGLAGYPKADVAFRAAEPGALVPARADGSMAVLPFSFVLHELGGVSTYFDAEGRPISRVVAGGNRLDWTWETGESGRLSSVTDGDGARTVLDWSDPSRVVIAPGATVTDPVDGSGAGGRWQIDLDGGRVSGVSDPVGDHARIGYDRHGLVERVSTPTGAATTVAWQSWPDSVRRVDRVRVIDEASGAELSARQWGVQGQVAPSGWPAVSGAPPATTGAGSPTVPGYETSVSDGKTRVTSVIDGARRLTGRAVVVASGAGERVVQDHAFEYSEADASRGAPTATSRPTTVSTTHHSRDGASRSAAETYAFDGLGRMVSRTAADGSTTRRVYDDEVPGDGALPIGLVIEETTTAFDGLVTSTRSELSADHSAVVATERWTGRAGGPLTRTARVERDVDRGFVTEQRAFPGGDPVAEPVVTRWSQQLDLVHGTRTIVQTVAAGTPLESSTATTSSLVHGGVLSEADVLGRTVSARYDPAGRQLSLADEAGRTVERQHRTRQRDGVNSITEVIDSGLVVTETRDVLGRVVRRADNVAPSGRAVEGHERVFETREYEAPGVVRVTDAWGASTRTELDVFGRTERVTLPNGVVQVAEYDDVAGSATSGVSLTRDLADAEVTSTTTTEPAGRWTVSTGVRADGVAVPEVTAEFDGLGRAVGSTTGRTRSAIEYDARGNAVASTIGPADGAMGAQVTAERRFDEFGNSIAQLTPDGVRIDTTYWADGSRREQTSGGASTRFYWDGPTLLNEVHAVDEVPAADGTMSGTASYLIGTSRHARIVRDQGASGPTYYGTDRHGSVTELTDASGAVTTRYGYTDYGVRTEAGALAEPLPGGIRGLGSNPFQYAAEYTFQDGTQSLGARLYDPAQARFLSKDSAPLANLYAFGDLNPITNVDPTGRESERDVANISASVTGFVLTLLGAGLMIATGGTALAGFGAFGLLVNYGEVVLAALEAVDAFAVRFMDPQATQIAAWGFFAFGVLTAGVGIGKAVAKRLPRSVIQKTDTITKTGSSNDGGTTPGVTPHPEDIGKTPDATTTPPNAQTQATVGQHANTVVGDQTHAGSGSSPAGGTTHQVGAPPDGFVYVSVTEPAAHQALLELLPKVAAEYEVLKGINTKTLRAFGRQLATHDPTMKLSDRLEDAVSHISSARRTIEGEAERYGRLRSDFHHSLHTVQGMQRRVHFVITKAHKKLVKVETAVTNAADAGEVTEGLTYLTSVRNTLGVFLGKPADPVVDALKVSH